MGAVKGMLYLSGIESQLPCALAENEIVKHFSEDILVGHGKREANEDEIGVRYYTRNLVLKKKHSFKYRVLFSF